MEKRIIKVEFQVNEQNYKEYEKIITELENNLQECKVENFSVIEMSV